MTALRMMGPAAERRRQRVVAPSTSHPSGAIAACAARTSPPCRPSATVTMLSSPGTASPRACRRHLGRGGEIPELAGEAEVGVREQTATRVHDVCIAARADLDLGDQLQDGLEIDLGDGDLHRIGAHRHGEGDMRLRVVPEVVRG